MCLESAAARTEALGAVQKVLLLHWLRHTINTARWSTLSSRVRIPIGLVVSFGPALGMWSRLTGGARQGPLLNRWGPLGRYA